MLSVYFNGSYLTYLDHDRIDSPMSDKSILKEVVSFVMRLHVFTVKKNISFVSSRSLSKWVPRYTKQICSDLQSNLISVPHRSEEIRETLLLCSL